MFTSHFPGKFARNSPIGRHLVDIEIVSISLISPTNEIPRARSFIIPLIADVIARQPTLFPPNCAARRVAASRIRMPALFACASCGLSDAQGRRSSRRMIIKRGRVAWTFGKRPRFVQQSALTADRNTWTRPASAGAGGGCGRERGPGRGVGWKGPVILTGVFAPRSLAGAILRNA